MECKKEKNFIAACALKVSSKVKIRKKEKKQGKAKLLPNCSSLPLYWFLEDMRKA